MWTGQRREQLPPNWKQLRQACKEAAGGQCQALMNGYPPKRCPHQGSEAHHPTPNDHTTLVWLCSFHHHVETEKQARQARSYLNSRYPPGTHPGLSR